MENGVKGSLEGLEFEWEYLLWVIKLGKQGCVVALRVVGRHVKFRRARDEGG